MKKKINFQVFFGLVMLICSSLVLSITLTTAHAVSTTLELNVSDSFCGTIYGIYSPGWSGCHTGNDYCDNWDTVLKSLSYGRVAFRYDMPVTPECEPNKCSGRPDHGMGRIVETKYLLTNGEEIYGSYNHLNQIDGLAQLNFWVVKDQIVAYMGASGQESSNYYKDVHLHFEIKKDVGIGSPVDGGFSDCINPAWGYIRCDVDSPDDCITIGDPDNFGYKDPAEYLSQPNVNILIPFVSKTNPEPNQTDFDVYGVANQNIYGYLPANGLFEHVGLVVRQSGSRNDAENSDVSAEHPFLAEAKSQSIDGIRGNHPCYEIGDHLLLAYVKLGSIDNNEDRYGYPIKFNFVSNSASRIVDNDQRNEGNYQFNQSLGDVETDTNTDTNLVPGYFLTAQLVKGKRNAWATWKPDISGSYRVYVHVPSGFPSGGGSENLIYRIKADGTDENKILSAPLNQSDNLDSWVQVFGTGGEDKFYFNSQGYIELYLGTNVSDSSSNSNVDENTWVAFDAVRFDNLEVDVALVIDSSGSMSWNDPLGLRKVAAKIFVDTARDDDQIAVVDFDGAAFARWPLQHLTANRNGIKSAIGLIDSIGGTNISRGLLVGHDELNSSTQAYRKAAVLLTDGQGFYNNEADLYKDEGWPIYTIGLGYNTNPELLEEIANKTCGKYFELTDPNQLQSVYFEIAAQIAGGSVIASESSIMSTGDTYSVAVAIPAGQQSATFLTNWPGSDVNTSLTTPSGAEITPATSDPNIYYAKGLTYELYRITNPEAGNWTANLYGADLAPQGETVNISVFSIGPPVAQDTTPPLIIISNPIDGKTYFNQLPTSFNFAIEDPETAVTSQTALLNGSPINNNDNVLLTQLGENVLTITATNEANLTSELSIIFYVNHFTWLPPIKYEKGLATQTITYIAQANSTLPIKFAIFNADDSFIADNSVKVIVEGTTAQFLNGEGDTNIRINQEEGEDPLYIVNLHTNFNKCDYGLEAGNEYNLTVYFNDILAARTKLRIK